MFVIFGAFSLVIFYDQIMDAPGTCFAIYFSYLTQ